MLTVAATLVLLAQLPAIAHRADVARDPASADQDVRNLGNELPHSAGGLAVLLGITALNVVKPRGLTLHGWRRERLESQAAGGLSQAKP